MRHWILLLIVFAACTGAWVLSHTASAAQPPRSLEPHDRVLDAPALAQGNHSRTRVTPDGVTSVAAGGVYTTLPQQVPGFTDVLPSWRAAEPISSTLNVYIRTSADGKTWGPWGLVEESHDLLDERDAADLHWGSPLFAGNAAWWQAEIHFSPAPTGELPVLHELRVSTVDVGALPDPGAQPSASAQNIAKPPVISRTQWGSGDGQGSRVPPAYYPVSHMVVHHTVDSNSLGANEGWWGDRVRAIWSFHTFTRGWGDIGYNYLVAPSGQIFEGRAGGDNAVGFHDTGNYGSMGVSLVGTYSSVPPTSAAQDSLVNILAWKAAQRGIDPLGSSYYYGCDISRYCGNPGAVTLNIAGHRQVANNPTGYTACPGDNLFGLLPTIRSRVKSLLSSAPDNGDLTIDELESSFTRSQAQWYESNCGDGGHIFYTYATNNSAESTNRGTWRKEGLEPGNYRIYAHIPQNCGVLNATQSARYRIWQGGVEIGPPGGKVISQDTTTEWVEITNGLTAHSDLPVEVHLTDLTGDPLSANRKVIFDTVRWVKDVPQPNVSLDSVQYQRLTIAGGEMLKATFTVRNTGPIAIKTQAPTPGDPGDPRSGYTYDEGECFLGNASGTYPAFPKESGRFRVMLGGDGLSGDCLASTGGYPWRWGLGGDLQPGETRTIVGYVRFRNSGPNDRVVRLRAGLINEYVAYVAQDRATEWLTIEPENDPPHSSIYNANFQPQATVYELAPLPDDFLARTANPLSIPEGGTLGTISWDGSRMDWGDSGPFGHNDFFIVRQSRSFVAPVDGVYSFRLTSDDGAWLWIDGALLTEAHGLHPEREVIGQVWLAAGEHRLAFKYFERTAQAVMSYEWQTPGSTEWRSIPTAPGGGAPRYGTIFGPSAVFTFDADDQGGAGVSHILWSLDGTNWTNEPGSRLVLSPGGGVYQLQYAAVDEVGNVEPVRQLSWQVDATPPSSSITQAGVDASGVIQIRLNGSDAMSGVARYTVSVRDQADGIWRLAASTSSTSAAFFGTPGHTYDLRVQAVDRVGNQEAPHAVPDATGLTVPAGAVFQRIYTPLISR